MLQTFNVPSGGRQIDAKGNFFRYEAKLTSNVDDAIRVRADGQDLGIFYPGDSAEDLPIMASRWSIEPVSAALQCSVRIGMGKVRASRQQGIMSVTDSVGSGVQTISNSAGLAVTGGLVSFQLIDPATNLRGLTVKTMILSVRAGAGGQILSRIFAAPVAPVAFNGNLLWMCLATDSAGTLTTTQLFNMNRSIPPGWGLFTYHQITVSAALTHDYVISYEMN